MIDIQDDLNDLDRMIDGNAPKDEVRSQLRLIAREVAALQTERDNLADAYAKLQAKHPHYSEASRLPPNM